ncbi:hypothetical protein Q8A67_012059 [Cirrhinus molitorella]|uniref:Uncharacterized protein n=1 Tax=Cirrhinus molitorella TaxID=172907 RepID=A0AA88TNJ5_9TELE|nr:hypothetical protein Q8A67_012059 [Cirrhinus molitorella]
MFTFFWTFTSSLELEPLQQSRECLVSWGGGTCLPGSLPKIFETEPCDWLACICVPFPDNLFRETGIQLAALT